MSSLAFAGGAPGLGGHSLRQAAIAAAPRHAPPAEGSWPAVPSIDAEAGVTAAAVPLGLGASAGALVALRAARRQRRAVARKATLVAERPAQVAAVAPQVAGDGDVEYAPSQAVTADGSIKLGQAVSWNGKPGTVRWIGQVKFAQGEWVGVELAEASGMHDGSVLGVPYFRCAERRGVFATATQLGASAAGAVAPATGTPGGAAVPGAAGPSGGAEECISFVCAPAASVAMDRLVSKGPRQDADKGSPVAASLPIYKQGPASFGAWSCTPGGFPVAPRKTTEIFYILEGEGVLTDADGTPHCWRAGDFVVLPKGWSGRWDILRTIRKVWGVNDHPAALEQAESRRAVVGPPEMFEWTRLTGKGPRKSDWGEPEDFTRPLWKAGPTATGSWACTKGGFEGTPNRPTTEWFYVLEGAFFLTNLDGSSRRIGAGDTVILPKGWSGRWDVIEPVRKVWGLISH